MDRELEIYKTLYVMRAELGRYALGEETIIHMFYVYGNDELGYIGAHEEWFSPDRQGRNEPEFFDVKWHTGICATAQEAWDKGYEGSLRAYRIEREGGDDDRYTIAGVH